MMLTAQNATWCDPSAVLYVTVLGFLIMGAVALAVLSR